MRLESGRQESLPDLFANQLGCSSAVFPLSQKKLPQERVKRLLLIAILFASAGILLLERRQEPLQDENSPLGRIRFFGRGGEDRGMLAPVGAELGKAGGRKDEGWRSEAREVAIE